MIEEESVGHEISGIQDDRGQHVEEEGVRGQGGDVQLVGQEQEHADGHAHHDQQARLGEHPAQGGGHVET